MATKTKNKEFQLDPEWIYQDPIDFEHKKYKLLAYLQKCDKRFDELKIYPDFVELSLHLANLQSISKENTMLTTKKKFKSCDDEILFKELIPKKLPKLDDADQIEIDKTVKYSGQKIYEAFNIAKSIWTIAHDAISVHIRKNKERLEDGLGFIYLRRKTDEKLLVWEYEIKKDVDDDISNKYNPKSVEEGANILISAVMTGDSSNIMAPIINGANEFEQRMGRPMTYSEMRSMFG